MRTRLLAAACLLALGITGAQGQPDKSGGSDDAQFKKEWTEVKKRYSAVAVAYARRDAFVNAAGITKDICALYNVLGLPAPSGCGITFPRRAT